MIKHGEINPLSVFGLRQLDHCPPHFSRVCFSLQTDQKTILDWVWENTQGRFWFGDTWYSCGVIQKCLAFEIMGEASYFGLLIDKVNTFQYL